MAVVVGREPAPGRPDWLVVLWDDGEALHLPVQAWVRASLAIGRDVPDTVRDELREYAQQWKLYDRCLHWLARRARTRAEVRSYLQRLGTTPPVANAIIAELCRAGYLDDRRYAESLVASWRDRRSLAELRKTLLTRGVTRDVVDAVLTPLRNENAEWTAAFKVADKYWRTHAGTPARERRTKLARYLGRRGFSASVVRQVLQHLQAHAEDEVEAFLDSDSCGGLE
ncbi:MAG: RecX family transcriptional regulator [Thermoflavifilum sp.]|nr:RecX family transcriptional regulator [Thermoflavifilum sp.]MCL6513447.1 RecX family transcriptional regulator [Alicyclobacillus sp.]